MDADRYRLTGKPWHDTNYCDVCGCELLQGSLCKDCELELEEEARLDELALSDEHQHLSK